MLQVGPRVREQLVDGCAEFLAQPVLRCVEGVAVRIPAGGQRRDHAAGEARELPRVPVGREHGGHQVGLELSRLHAGHGVRRLAAVDPDRRAVVVQLTRVTEAAREIEQLGADLRVVVLRETYRQVARVPVGVWPLADLGEEPVARHVLRRGQAFAAERPLEVHEPRVAHAREHHLRRALGVVVEAQPVFAGPALPGRLGGRAYLHEDLLAEQSRLRLHRGRPPTHLLTLAALLSLVEAGRMRRTRTQPLQVVHRCVIDGAKRRREEIPWPGDGHGEQRDQDDE